MARPVGLAHHLLERHIDHSYLTGRRAPCHAAIGETVLGAHWGDVMGGIFDRSHLLSVAENNAEAYASADPFPHIALDGLFPEHVIGDVQQSFLEPDAVAWEQFDNARELKLAYRDEEHMPEPQLALLRELNSQVFVEFLGKLTGIGGLVPDPSYVGGGLHQILPGACSRSMQTSTCTPQRNCSAASMPCSI